MNKNDQEFLVEKIRTQYMEKGTSQLDELKALDAKVKRPAKVFSYVFGSIAALVMGTGMSLVMTDIGGRFGMEAAMKVGIMVGIAGLLMAVANYPVHKKILTARRKKYADQIIKLSNQMISPAEHV